MKADMLTLSYQNSDRKICFFKGSKFYENQQLLL